jgi:hypothetical protein
MTPDHVVQGLKIDCDYCGNPIEVPGALVFSPPDEEGRVFKLHACGKCWNNRLVPDSWFGAHKDAKKQR